MNLIVRAKVLLTFDHNKLMKAQAQRIIVPENCGEVQTSLCNLVYHSHQGHNDRW